MRAIVYSGGGDYNDPWHAFPQTSAVVAELLREAGFEVEVTFEVEAGLAQLVESGPRLVVLNCGTGGAPTPHDRAVESGIVAHAHRGGGLLALHTASTIFTEWSAWEQALGGRWVRGTSMHPAYGSFSVGVRETEELGLSRGGFRTDDEAYSLLHLADTTQVVATHRFDGRSHPLWWLNRWEGARVAYDALGHDVAAYDTAEQRDFIRRAAIWCATRGRVPRDPAPRRPDRAEPGQSSGATSCS